VGRASARALAHALARALARALALAAMVGAGMVWTPVARAQGQGWAAGRYALRSVNGHALPVDMPGPDARHKVRITGGTLILNADGTYVCETLAETSYLGLVQQRADTTRSIFDTVGGTAVTLMVTSTETDTVATTGQRITWTRVTQLSPGANAYLYSK
jgi:hypothetical protein